MIRTRMGVGALAALPRVALLAGALALAALGLFFLPAMFGVGGPDDGAVPSPSPTLAVATPTPAPTPEPSPTPQVYVIKSGDTLSKIAREFGVTVDDLLAANKDTISNPNKISVGDEIVIPVPPPEEVSGATEEATPAP
jgi:LysM repeat protein